MKKKSMAKQALKFILSIVLLTAVSYALLDYTPLRSLAASYAAYSTSSVLQTLGDSAEIRWLENPHLVSEKYDAELIPLCWGLLELALWAGVVFATDNRPLERRLKGFLLGTVGFLVFNPIRIAVTLKIFSPSSAFASFVAHDILFRTSILALFVAAYAVWYYWE
ncbi:hypothetical protein HZC09_07005 [Candidatus Micrarchaeota archaeon]|nr:hypothetical protein [Candidatus Micrarchaeota archaeon]